MQLGLNSLYFLEVCKIEWELSWLDGTKMHMQNLFEGNSWYGSVIIHTNVRLDSAQSSNFYELQPIYWQCESKKNLIDVKVSIVIPTIQLLLALRWWILLEKNKINMNFFELDFFAGSFQKNVEVQCSSKECSHFLHVEAPKITSKNI